MKNCKFILTEDVKVAAARREPIETCAAPVWRGSYCEEHWRRCYRPASRREVESFAALAEMAEAA